MDDLKEKYNQSVQNNAAHIMTVFELECQKRNIIICDEDDLAEREETQMAGNIYGKAYYDLEDEVKSKLNNFVKNLEECEIILTKGIIFEE